MKELFGAVALSLKILVSRSKILVETQVHERWRLLGGKDSGSLAISRESNVFLSNLWRIYRGSMENCLV